MRVDDIFVYSHKWLNNHLVVFLTFLTNSVLTIYVLYMYKYLYTYIVSEAELSMLIYLSIGKRNQNKNSFF